MVWPFSMWECYFLSGRETCLEQLFLSSVSSQARFPHLQAQILFSPQLLIELLGRARCPPRITLSLQLLGRWGWVLRGTQNLFSPELLEFWGRAHSPFRIPISLTLLGLTTSSNPLVVPRQPFPKLTFIEWRAYKNNRSYLINLKESSKLLFLVFCQSAPYSACFLYQGSFILIFFSGRLSRPIFRLTWQQLATASSPHMVMTWSFLSSNFMTKCLMGIITPKAINTSLPNLVL